METGHADAPDYPVAMLFEEIELVVDRENRRFATEASLTKAAINTGIAAFGKNLSKAEKQFADLVRKLSGSDDPEPTRRNKNGTGDGSKRQSGSRRRQDPSG